MTNTPPSGRPLMTSVVHVPPWEITYRRPVQIVHGTRFEQLLEFGATFCGSINFFVFLSEFWAKYKLRAHIKHEKVNAFIENWEERKMKLLIDCNWRLYKNIKKFWKHLGFLAIFLETFWHSSKQLQYFTHFTSSIGTGLTYSLL